jgi:hypothetical protein
MFLGGKRTWKMLKEVVVQDLKELMKMFKKCRIWCIQIDVLNIRAVIVQPNLGKRNICVCKKKGLKFGSAIGFSTMTAFFLSLKQFLAHKLITEMEHPPYSLDLALSDFWMFPKIESALKGQRFQDIDIQKNVMTSL